VHSARMIKRTPPQRVGRDLASLALLAARGATLLFVIQAIACNSPDGAARVEPPLGVQQATASLTAAPSYEELVMQDEPAGYWRLGEAPGATQAMDRTTNAHHGNYVARTLGSHLPQLGVLGAIEGDADTAARFFWYNHYGQTPITQWNYVEVPNQPNPNQPSVLPTAPRFSLEAWFTMPQVAHQTYAGIIATSQNGHNGFGIIYFPYEIRFFIGSLNSYASFPMGLATPGGYHHIVATWDGTTANVYLDGTRVASKVVGFFNPGAGPLYIGKAWLGSWQGSIDEAAIYHHVLSEERVLEHYRRSAPEYVACAQPNVQQLVVSAGAPFDLASDGDRLFWTDPVAGVIQSAPIQGGQPDTLVDGIEGLHGLAVDDTHVYFTDSGTKTVRRASKSDGAVEIVASTQRYPRSIANDGDRVVWTNEGYGRNDGALRQYVKSTGAVESVIDGQPAPSTLVVANEQIFWGDVLASAVQRKIGISFEPQVITFPTRYPSLAASGSLVAIASSDGRVFDFDLATSQGRPRPTQSSGVSSVAAIGASLFFANATRQTVSEQLSPTEYGATVWKRTGEAAPRTVRAEDGVVRFSVSNPGSDDGAIFAFVPNSPPDVPHNAMTCPPGGRGEDCDLTSSALAPYVQCVREASNGRLIAHFAYVNADSLPRRMGVGPLNHVTGDDSGDACQPTTFLPGPHSDVFAAGFTTAVTWQLGQRTATATRSSQRCAAGEVGAPEVFP
jgi:hypothetical protein